MRVKSSSSSMLPLLIESKELYEVLENDNVIVVDLSLPAVHKEGHVPGAVWLAYPSILHPHDDTDCDIPPDEKLTKTLSDLGIKPEHHVVAYDSQGCPMAARFLWTLEELGHKNFSMLNGGWSAWKDEGLPVEQESNVLEPSVYKAKQTGKCNALRDYILSKLNDDSVILLDSRMEEEFTNELIITDRGGYIPGAIHFDWMSAVNEEDNMRMRSLDELNKTLEDIGVSHEKEIIAYCQTHFRSAYVYMMLKILGYPMVKGYASGYSEWGNAEDTPIQNEVVNLDDMFEKEEEAPVAKPEGKPQLSVISSNNSNEPDYKVKDISLSNVGEKLYGIAEASMHGLNAMVETYKHKRPFQGLRISGCLSLTPSVAVLIKALTDLGASVRWSDVTAGHESDMVAAYLAEEGIPVFTSSDTAPVEAQSVVERSLIFPGDRMPQILIDDSDESCLLSIRTYQHSNDIKFETASLGLDKIKSHIGEDFQQLLVEVIIMAKWEIRAHQQSFNEEDDMKVWVADPMKCHCDSIVMLKNTLCACA